MPNINPCFVAGSLSAGLACAESLSGIKRDLSVDEMIDFMTAQAERECVPVKGMTVCADDQSTGARVKLAKRAGAVLISADDYNKQKTALEQACRSMGRQCSNEIKQTIQAMAAFQNRIERVEAVLP